MSLQKRIESDLRKAMLSRNDLHRDTIRLLLSVVKNKAKDLRRDLDDSEIQQVISTAIKQRKESVEQYRKGNREELAAAEEQEIEVLREFLPEPLSPEQLEGLIDQAIADTGAQSMRELGKVMKQVMPQVAGRADGKQINEIVRRRLA